MRLIVPVAALAALLLLALPAVAQEAPKPAVPAAATFQIELKRKAGHVVRHRIKTENESKTNHPATGEAISRTATTMVAVETVKSVDEKGVVATELYYESAIVNQDTPQAKFDWDSEKPDVNDGPAVAIYKVMLKHKYSMKYDHSGKLIDVTGFDSMLEAFFKTIEDERIREMLRTTLTPVLGDKGMLRTIGSGHFLPGKPVGIGDIWEVNSEVAFPLGSGKMDASAKFKLDAVETAQDGKLAQISGTGDMKLAKAEADDEQNGERSKDQPKGPFDMFDITVVNGKHRVDVTFNIDRGVVVKQVNKQTFDTNMAMKGGNVTITQKVANTITIELLPPKAEPEAKQPETGKTDK